jgi:thioredoxin reductase
MNELCDVAIVGAGPYGLSLGAHLRARGVNFRIFGKPLDTWRAHMPKGMLLKSEGFASNLSAPDHGSTLKAYCAANNIPYADRALPISLDLFLAYGDWFRARYVPNLEETLVRSITQEGKLFRLELETGEKLSARQVVLACGVSWFSHIPQVLQQLPQAMLSHSYEHRDVSRFKGRDVAILGAGSSAIDLAYELHEQGARVHIISRAPALKYNDDPSEDADTLAFKLKNPPSPIGKGWRSYFCALAPLLVYRLPRGLRARAIASHMHAAGGWFMCRKVEGRIAQSCGRTIAAAEVQDGRVRLTLADSTGKQETLICDHVIAATGYQVDMRRLAFLSPELRAQISPNHTSPAVSSHFETSVPGFFTIGMTGIASFGPLLRFMVGSEFVAPRLAAYLQARCSRFHSGRVVLPIAQYPKKDGVVHPSRARAA